MIRKLFNILFWLALSLYLGGTIALGAIVAPAVFDTTKSAHINLPGISPPLDPTSQAGGEIFGVILQRFWYVEIAALMTLLIVIVAWFILQRPVRRCTIILAGLWLLIAALVAYDTLSLTPRVWTVRQQVRDTAPAHAADLPTTPWPQRSEFDTLHKRAETLGHIKAYALLAMLIVAAWRGTPSCSVKKEPNPQPPKP